MTSHAQQIAIAIVPKFSGFLSVYGSGFIIYDILMRHFNISRDWWRKDNNGNGSRGLGGSLSTNSSHVARYTRRQGNRRKTLKNSAYYRLMLAMSISDFMVSFAWFCTTWPIPKDENSIDNPSDYVYGNSGTIQTCTAQGFFVQLGIITPFYNALLACYYYLTIRREWKEKEFKRKVEYIGHFIAISFGFGTAIAGLVMDLFNNSYVWCWIAPYPRGCSYDVDDDDKEPCLRGKHSGLFRWAFYYGPLWVMIFLVTFFMTLVYAYVRSLDRKMDKYTRPYHASAISSANARSGDHTVAPNEPQPRINRRSLMTRTFSVVISEAACESKRERRNERSKAVANQGLFYAGTFALVWVFGTIVRAMQLAGRKPPWPITFLFAVFTPTQGFFNFLVYVRPRAVKYISDRKIRKSARNSENMSQLLRVSGMSSTHSATANEHFRQPSGSRKSNTNTNTNMSELELSETFRKSKEEDDEDNEKNSKVRFVIDEGKEASTEIKLSDTDIQETMIEESFDPKTPSPIATDEIAEKDETSITNEAGEKVVESQNADIYLTTPTSDSLKGESIEVGIEEEKKDENDKAVNNK